MEAAGRGMAFRPAEPHLWREMQRRAMARDFSREKAARKYTDLYEEILAGGKTGAGAAAAIRS